MSHLTSVFPLLGVRIHETGTYPVHDLEIAARGAGLLMVGHRGRSVSCSRLGGVVLLLVSEIECDTVVVLGKPTSAHGTNLGITELISDGKDDDGVLTRAAAIALEHRSGARIRLSRSCRTTVTQR